MADDPLSDPLSSASLNADAPAWSPSIKAPHASPWARRDDLFAEEPFSNSGIWGGEHLQGRAAAEGAESKSGQDMDREDAGGSEDTFSYPSSSTSPKRNLDTISSLPGFPAAIPFRNASSGKAGPSSGQLGRPSISPTTTLNYGVSVTPRASPSPFLQLEAAESIKELQQSRIGSPSSPHDPETPQSAEGLSPAVLKGLVATACVSGNVPRLKALLSGGDGSDEYPSMFVLANMTSPITSLAPLHYAAKSNQVDVVRYLVEEAGAIIEMEDGEGQTPLTLASYKGHVDVVKYLVAAGANAEASDGDGWTPLMNASSKGFLDVVRFLVETAGVQIDTRSKHGYSALMNAATQGHLPIVHFLTTKHRCNPLLRNAWGETAYSLAAAVFEVAICAHLSTYESTVWASTPGRPPYNPLSLHSSCPVVLHENQRLARPTLKKLSSLATLAQNLRWSSKALSRNDARGAFGYPSPPGTKDVVERPALRNEIGLPVVGNEGELVLPVEGVAVKAVGGKNGKSIAGNRRTSASSSLSAALGNDTPAASTSTTYAGEPAWMWTSDWVVDLTDPRSSPSTGWSYASSFDSPPDGWTPEPSPELARLLDGAGGMGFGGQKWIRRRRWVRIMRRRVDLADWGYADNAKLTPTIPLIALPDTTSSTVLPSTSNFLVKAQFLAGHTSTAASDRLSIRSGKTADHMGEGELDRTTLRKAAARLERAIEELRAGILTEEDSERRFKAEDELAAFLHQLQLITTELGPWDPEEDSDDEFVYDGRDADDDDGRSVRTNGRRDSRASSVSSSRYSETGLPPHLSPTKEEDAPADTDLTPQLSRAPDFRVPTHDQAYSGTVKARRLSSIPPTTWEADESARTCCRCEKTWGFFTRRHHCRLCGRVVCATCSPHMDRIDESRLVLEPGALNEQQYSVMPLRYRTCDPCHLTLSLPQGLGAPSILQPGGLFYSAASSSHIGGSASPMISESGRSDVSELGECPVCGTVLATLGGQTVREEHVNNCLETGNGAIAKSGRYLVFTLPPGPLVQEECGICFVELEIGDRLGRLPCLCVFHVTCMAWFERSKTCPFHAGRE